MGNIQKKRQKVNIPDCRHRYGTLLPKSQPDTEVMHDHVEKKEVPEHPCHESKHDGIDDLIPAALRRIESADAFLFIPIVGQGSEKGDQPDTPKHPLVPAIKRIG